MPASVVVLVIDGGRWICAVAPVFVCFSKLLAIVGHCRRCGSVVQSFVEIFHRRVRRVEVGSLPWGHVV